MRRHFVSGFSRALLSLSQEKSSRSGVEIVERRCLLLLLRIHFAHLQILGLAMGVASRNAGIFLRGLKLCGENNRTQQGLLVHVPPPPPPQKKIGVTMHFSEIIKLQFEKERQTLFCILELFTNIDD